MLRSLRAAETAMNVQQTRIDTLANNLANVDTTGFRQVLERVRQQDPAEAAGGTALRSARGSGDDIYGRWPEASNLESLSSLDSRPGELRATNRATDVAINGEGWFVVESANGERYTRDGAFRLDAERTLVTSAGLPVLGDGGPITIEGADWRIDDDGQVMVDGTSAGALRIVRFGDATRLEHSGTNLLRAPRDLEPEAVPSDEIKVQQGFLEGSNVDPIRTLVAMIAAQRAFEINAKIVTSTDETLDKSVNQVGVNRG